MLFKAYITCDKECTMATRLPNPISLYLLYMKRKVVKQPSFSIKHVLMLQELAWQ